MLISKTGRIFILLILTLCSTSHAKSLRDADIPNDLRSILTGFQFVSGDPVLKATVDQSLSGSSVFSGSAYCVFNEPTPAPSDYVKLTEQVRDGFQQLYSLKPSSHSGTSGIQTTDKADKTGQSFFTWTDVHGDPSHSNVLISFTVQAVPLPDSKLGIVLTYVEVHHAANKD